MLTFPHPGFWAIHIIGVAVVYMLGKNNACEHKRSQTPQVNAQ
ncbi:MAG: hypothetical protein M0Z31_12585 [Clostridia bacterium]|nr:hypothetical protein [Clostridia bacterium]